MIIYAMNAGASFFGGAGCNYDKISDRWGVTQRNDG